MKVAKEYRWEMGHRLSFRNDKCSNLHGHSYSLIVEFEGEIDSSGMLIDYFEIDRIMDPLIARMDHRFFVPAQDEVLASALRELGAETFVADFNPTSECLVLYYLKEIAKAGLPKNVKRLSLRLSESPGSYAEDSLDL